MLTRKTATRRYTTVYSHEIIYADSVSKFGLAVRR